MAELMKGQSWSDRYLKGKLRFEFPVFAEEKRDEIRAHFRLVRDKITRTPVCVEVVSYAGKPLYNLGRQCELMFTLFMRVGLEELDCGVEVNGNYNDSYRLVRSSKGVPEDLLNATVDVLVYDIPAPADGQHEYRFRSEYIREWLLVRAHPRLRLKAPRQWICHDEDDIMWHYCMVRGEGVEGLMIKTMHHAYQRKRSWDWFKLKPEETYDGRITGFVEAICGVNQPELGLRVGDPLRRAGAVAVILEDGSTASPHGIPHNLGKDMLENPEKYIGEWVEFSCMERDRQGGYRHPIFKRLREAKA